MQVSLQGKNILITGGVRGIGRAMTEAAAKAGGHVIATYLSNEATAKDVIGGLQSQGLNVHACKLDVRDSKQVDEAVAALESEYGPIEVLINNAGIVKDGLLMAMEDDDWNDVLNTNLGGAFHVTRAVARQMIRARRGQIINISSVAASRPGRGQVNYAASKGGIEAATKALAVELSSRNIRVNCIAPGVITTEMSQDVREAAGDKILESILLKRFGNPEDIANMAVFLASDLASYITGEVIHIDGGLKL
ncbi:MAG: 3-oxoacyl-ACP reductase FabG [Pseudomonadota bacterium]